ncbi:MAG TPA: spondin domain-containing protein [Bacteriovoracaceae bacterium]|nr:spondin domain-containing protein [Bacteriovoracaceae bacterium]
MKKLLKKEKLLSSVFVMGLLTLAACGGNNDDNNDSSDQPPQQQEETGARNFTVTIQNVSRPGLLRTSLAEGTVPLSPGVYAVYGAEMENPAFTPGQMADIGTERIAEDGFIEPPMGFETTLLTDAKSSGSFSAPGGVPNSPEITAGESTTFTVSAVPGDRLTFETMFVQSNDWFFADSGQGIALFDAAGNPASGDVTSQVALWDAGTEIDEKPGKGIYQKLLQAPDATDVGPQENRNIEKVSSRYSGWRIPQNSEVIKVIITPQ